jgi:Calcineurin-like phosphoesterase
VTGICRRLTAIPYHCSKEEKSIWLERDSTVRRQTGIPWIVLHHVPAKTGLHVSGEESEAAELLATYRPDYFISGHDHAFPYASGQSWSQGNEGLNNASRVPSFLWLKRHRNELHGGHAYA